MPVLQSKRASSFKTGQFRAVPPAAAVHLPEQVDFRDLKQQWFQEVTDLLTNMVAERFGAPTPAEIQQPLAAPAPPAPAAASAEELLALTQKHEDAQTSVHSLAQRVAENEASLLATASSLNETHVQTSTAIRNVEQHSVQSEKARTVISDTVSSLKQEVAKNTTAIARLEELLNALSSNSQQQAQTDAIEDLKTQMTMSQSDLETQMATLQDQLVQQKITEQLVAVTQQMEELKATCTKPKTAARRTTKKEAALAHAEGSTVTRTATSE